MKLKSYSKINLSLNVNRKSKKSRLHEIESYFCLIDLFDQIKIKKNQDRKDIVKFKGKFSKNINKINNSIIDTLNILRERNLISDYYSILVSKKIPVFSGMGGGTSNAACLIKYFTKNKINKNLLHILSKKIGSDLKLFFYKQGFLKNIKTINVFRKRYKLNFLLVYPNIRSSTKHVYSKVKKYHLKSKYNLIKINDKNKYINFLTEKNNDLQSIVENKHPIIKKLIIEISQNRGCYFSRMTGSGSVCYGVFKTEKTAKAALKRIKMKHPKYWVSVAKTI
ncbi:4-(cytidine 5'-diphospho)-2-C-methyl-D-erythritol kinase [Pelagibacterales bacterium SAG-MED05]|nr:4-(cytidine 5'-diphospho)-2-C-methyl-D-erythritol kinase [Pelagibacterales bacterium SAG-MED05]